MGTRLGSPEVKKYRARAAKIFGLRCYFCLNVFPLEELTLEHLIPIARGGSAKAINNHALSCFDCNNEKSGLTVVEYCAVKGYDIALFNRRGELKAGVTKLKPVTNKVDLARLELLR